MNDNSTEKSFASEQKRKVPEYYPEMYLDGFSPEEIMNAAHDKIYNDYLANKDDGGDDDEPEVRLTIEVKKHE